MKITFEGPDIADIVDQASVFIADVVLKVRKHPAEPAPEEVPRRATAQATAQAQNEVKEVLRKIEQRLPADIAALSDPPAKRPRTAKQLENDERLRVAAKAKIEAKRAAKATVSAALETPLPPVAVHKPVEKPVDPAEVIKIRQKTINDLQEAYANGHQQEVFELLSRFGNGAKSFRELPPESFVPIREAIDKGALT